MNVVYHLKSSDRLKQEIKCMRFIDFHRILYTVRENGNSLEYDVRRHIWLVNVGRIVTFSLGNENSARQVYQLITRDILNYISFRWGRPQQ